MIVLCGIPSEPPMRMVRDAADRLGLEVHHLNQRESAITALAIDATGGRPAFRQHGPGGTRDLATASGMLVRLTDWRVLPEYRRAGDAATRDRLRIEAWHGLLGDWLETAPLLVMNRTKPSNSNMSKPYQARLIAGAGFRVPETIVTNQVAVVRAFKRRHRRVIFKSISAHRSIVTELTSEAERHLERIRLLPTQFQELIEGDDVRVHVVARKLFATRIRSETIDYRYAGGAGGGPRYEPMALPDRIAERCLDLSRRLDLPLCGIDLKLMADGGYACFEVNPAPAFSSFEERSGQPIAEAIARALAGI